MRIDTMGKVLVMAKMENLQDLYMVETGHLPADQVRCLEVEGALVDTGVTILSMPKRMIEPLGLCPIRQQQARTRAGIMTVTVHSAVRLTIQERDCVTDVAELPDDCSVIVGRIPLAMLDFVVDPAGQRLIGNPEHGGEHILEMY